jgi:hypothetical protein
MVHREPHSEQQQASGPPNERRTDERTARKRVVFLAHGELGQSEFEEAELVDCSPHGIGIMMKRGIAMHVSLMVRLKTKPASFAVYDVRHCVASGPKYKVGALYEGFVGSPQSAQPEPESICSKLIAE